MVQTSLGRKLRILRGERGLSMRRAADLCGVTKETLSALERGTREPHDPTLAKIAKGYGVPFEELLEEPVPLGEAPRDRPEPSAGLAGSEVSHEAQRRRLSYLAGGIEHDVRRWEEWIAEVRESADVPGTDKRTWARTIGLAAMQRYADVEAQGAVEPSKAEAYRTPEGARLWDALQALLAIPQAATDASVGARQVSAVLTEVEEKAPEILAREKQARLAQ